MCCSAACGIPIHCLQCAVPVHAIYLYAACNVLFRCMLTCCTRCAVPLHAYTLHVMCCSAACSIPICCMRCAVPLHAYMLHAMCCSAACLYAARDVLFRCMLIRCMQCAVPLHAYMLHAMCCSTACFLAACDVPQTLFHHLPLHLNQSIRSAGWSTRPATWQSLDPLSDANTLADANCPAARAPPLQRKQRT